MLDAFVRAPYDRFVVLGTHFWNASAVLLVPGAGGLEARLTSPEIAAVGGVSFATPAEAQGAQRVPANTLFTLYSNSAEANSAPLGLEVPYQVGFTGPVGELQRGAPVKLDGFIIGRVLSTRLVFDERTATLRTPVTIGIDARRLNLPEERSSVDAMVARLVRRGWRAKLDQSPPVIGGRLVTFAMVKGGPVATLRAGSPYPWLPTASAGDVAGLADTAV